MPCYALGARRCRASSPFRSMPSMSRTGRCRWPAISLPRLHAGGAQSFLPASRAVSNELCRHGACRAGARQPATPECRTHPRPAGCCSQRHVGCALPPSVWSDAVGGRRACLLWLTGDGSPGWCQSVRAGRVHDGGVLHASPPAAHHFVQCRVGVVVRWKVIGNRDGMRCALPRIFHIGAGPIAHWRIDRRRSAGQAGHWVGLGHDVEDVRPFFSGGVKPRTNRSVLTSAYPPQLGKQLTLIPRRPPSASSPRTRCHQPHSTA